MKPVGDTMFQHPSSAFDTSQQLQLQLHQNTCKYNTQINFSTEPTIQLLCNLCLAYSQKRYAMFSCDCVKCHCNIYINNNNNYNYNKPSNEHRSPQSRSQSTWCDRTTNALTALPCSRGLKANRWQWDVTVSDTYAESHIANTLSTPRAAADQAA